jgi:hypothetical protein
LQSALSLFRCLEASISETWWSAPDSWFIHHLSVLGFAGGGRALGPLWAAPGIFSNFLEQGNGGGGWTCKWWNCNQRSKLIPSSAKNTTECTKMSEVAIQWTRPRCVWCVPSFNEGEDMTRILQNLPPA